MLWDGLWRRNFHCPYINQLLIHICRLSGAIFLRCLQMPSIIWPDTTKDNWLWPLSLVYLLENIFLGLFLYVHVLLIVYRGPFTWTALSGPTCGILDVWHLSVASREMELLGTDVDVVGGTEGAILTELSILLICTHFTLFLIVFFYGSPGTRTHKRPMVLEGAWQISGAYR